MEKKGFYYLWKSFQLKKKKSLCFGGEKKRIKIKHKLSKIGIEGAKVSMNSQSNHCSWDALLGLRKPNSKNLFRVRRKGVVLKKITSEVKPRQTRWCSSFCFCAEIWTMQEIWNFSPPKKKIQWKMLQTLQLTKTRKEESQPWTHAKGTMVNTNTEQT